MFAEVGQMLKKTLQC